MSAEQTPDIERVLAEHDQCDSLVGPVGVRFSCGITYEFRPDDSFAHARRAHVAQALAPVLAAAVRDAEQRAWDEGAHAAVELHNAGTRMTLRAVIPFPENPYRADRVAEPQHEAATSGKESEASDE